MNWTVGYLRLFVFFEGGFFLKRDGFKKQKRGNINITKAGLSLATSMIISFIFTILFNMLLAGTITPKKSSAAAAALVQIQMHLQKWRVFFRIRLANLCGNGGIYLKTQQDFFGEDSGFQKKLSPKNPRKQQKNVKKKNTKDSVDRRNPKQPPNMCEAPANNVIFTKRSYM